MRASSRSKAEASNFAPDQLVAKATRNGIRPAKSFLAYQEELRRLIRAAWPECTAKYLAAAGDISQRQAERILARQREISFELFWRLMESKECGFRFYFAVLGSLTTRWSEKERHEREGAILDNQMRALAERKRQWQERSQ